jgi:hypothetical protein
VLINYPAREERDWDDIVTRYPYKPIAEWNVNCALRCACSPAWALRKIRSLAWAPKNVGSLLTVEYDVTRYVRAETSSRSE